MKIVEHMLSGDCIDFKETPNKDKVFDNGLPDTIIIHYTAGRSRETSVKWFCNPNAKASAHLVIGRNGKITQLVPFDVVAYHAGKSSYKGRVGFNNYSIGIELDNAGRLEKTSTGYSSWFNKLYDDKDVLKATHRNETTISYWHRYTDRQIEKVYDVCLCLIGDYNIKSILGHEEISPARKSDPGPAFPLDKLRERFFDSDRSENTAPEPVPESKSGIVNASKLNIRSMPSASADKVAPPLERGTKLKILQEKNGWYEVLIGTKGWVKKDYVEV